MPLTFANPSLLFGGLAAAVPVIIHFLSRRRARRRLFSDLRFLDEVQSRQARSLGIRRWLLLLLRVLALLLLAAAMAGPRWGGLGKGRQDLPVLFVVDTSASMNTQTAQGTRLQEALDACRDMIQGLPTGTQVQVLAAGARITPLFGGWLPAGTVPPGALAGVTPSDGALPLAAVLQEAARRLSEAATGGMRIVLVSDLQEVPGPAGLQEIAARLAEAGEVQILVKQIGSPVPGGGVVRVDLPQRALRPGETVTLGAAVIPDLAQQPFTLELDGRIVAETVAAGAVGIVQDLAFSVTVPAPGLHSGAVRKRSDTFPGDDVRPFVLPVPAAVDVLLAHGRDRPGEGAAGRGGWRFLEQALAPTGSRTPFRVRPVAGADLTTGDLLSAQVLVLVDPDPLGRTLLDAVLDWVDSGGALLVAAGDPTLQEYLGATLLPALGLPGQARYRSVPEVSARRTRIVYPDHPVFAGFPQEALGTLAEIRWTRWFQVDAGPARVMLSMVGDDPVLVEGDRGQGVFALLPANLLPTGSTLAGSPMALPFFQRLTAWLVRAGLEDGVGNLVAGEIPSIRLRPDDPRLAADRLPQLVVQSPGQEGGISPVLTWRGGRPFLSGEIADRAGLVAFRAGTDTLGLVAVALPASESALDLLTPRQWLDMAGREGLDVAGDLTAVAPTALGGALLGRSLAPWLLGITFLLLLAETVVGRGVSRSATAG